MLIKEPGLGAREMQYRLEDQFTVTLSYNKVWEGRKLALKELHGTWEDSFKLLWNWKAAVEATCPGSLIEIDCKKVKGQMHFSKMFVALRPCVNGFLMGCRPYLGVDSTHLTGKYLGQLASATAIDGHNWMYPVAYAIFDKETNLNWKWFMTLLKRAIGTPPGLTIHTDACKGLAYGVSQVFGDAAEHRECFRHLMANFRRKYNGEVLKYMWPCAWACTHERHQVLMDKISETCPNAVAYLRYDHPHLWTRAKFNKICKVDYVNNNISECFNNWIKNVKELPAVDLMDMLRVMIMEKIATRQSIANKMQGHILPSVVNDLHEKSRNLRYTITKSGYMKGEVSGASRDGVAWRYGVNLVTQACSCGQWDVTGKPCTHAIAFITSQRNLRIEDYVGECYSVQRFKDAYQFEVYPMGDRLQWPKLDPGFEMRPPKLEGRPAGRPRKKRIKSAGEPGKRGPYQCKRCFQYGHIEKGCKNPVVEPHEDLPDNHLQRKTKKGTKKRKKSEPEQTSTSLVQISPSSSGPMTRRRVAMSPTCSSPSASKQGEAPASSKRRLII
ncbi:uncharacterized protein [Zea mays]|uniref:uncharacterized protein isoform X1 n=1 Tax=Zea mays TaxID=4577 RepID=UPI0004DECB1A|nr:uncharacterized protein LOC103647887 isoform X1 [Zea mays]|eukprot:XP_008670606.1 uncharacterized protein LOC103647887 isoform X1 [Zea mays]